jgi:hypothetical protein
VKSVLLSLVSCTSEQELKAKHLAPFPEAQPSSAFSRPGQLILRPYHPDCLSRSRMTHHHHDLTEVMQELVAHQHQSTIGLPRLLQQEASRFGCLQTRFHFTGMKFYA